MKKNYSQSKTNHQIISVDNSIYTLRISNFNPQIESSPFISNRYSYEDKIMKRREAIQTPYNLRREVFNPQNQRRAFSSQENRSQSQNATDAHRFSNSNKQFQNISSSFNDKISELKNLVNKKSANSKKNESKETQNVHFTEYILHSVYPASPSVLHSRVKKECSFMRSVKARNLMNRNTEAKYKSKAQDLFKSIELNNTSKYVNSKRILLKGTSNLNLSKQLKNMKYGSKGYMQHRQSQILKHKKVNKLEMEIDCKPWQTSNRFDHFDDDHNILNL